jgi:hypothetical protein
MSQNLENENHQSAHNRQGLLEPAERSPSRRERRSAAAGGPVAGLQGRHEAQRRPEQAGVAGAAWPPSWSTAQRRRNPVRQRVGGFAGPSEQRESGAATASQFLSEALKPQSPWPSL